MPISQRNFCYSIKHFCRISAFFSVALEASISIVVSALIESGYVRFCYSLIFGFLLLYSLWNQKETVAVKRRLTNLRLHFASSFENRARNVFLFRKSNPFFVCFSFAGLLFFRVLVLDLLRALNLHIFFIRKCCLHLHRH